MKNNFQICGTGLHTGISARIECTAAPINYGIKIQRIDKNYCVVPATLDHVFSCQRGTSLKSNGVVVHTVEHILSAFKGMGVDNALIMLNGPEIPILDGSAKIFVEQIIDAGIKEQKAKRKIIKLSEPFEYHHKITGSSYRYEPCDHGLELTTILQYDNSIGHQEVTIKTKDAYIREIADCRTFVLTSELELLLENGLIKGGNLNNALVFSDQNITDEKVNRIAELFGISDPVSVVNGLVNGKSLHFPNEPARHKLLDLVGDLSLIGDSLSGKITATKPGHCANLAFARLLKQKYQDYKL